MGSAHVNGSNTFESRAVLISGYAPVGRGLCFWCDRAQCRCLGEVVCVLPHIHVQTCPSLHNFQQMATVTGCLWLGESL